MYLEKREVLVLESDWDEFAKPLGQPSQFERLCGHLLKDGVGFKLIDMLLPFLGPAKVAQIGKEQVYLEVKICMQIVRFDVKFGPEEHYVVDLDLLFAVADQESFGKKAGLVIDDLSRHQVVVVGALLAGLGGLVLLVVAHVAAVGLRVLDMVRVVLPLRQPTRSDAVAALARRLVAWVIRRRTAIAILPRLVIPISLVCTFQLSLLLL